MKLEVEEPGKLDLILLIQIGALSSSLVTRDPPDTITIKTLPTFGAKAG